MSKIIIIVSEQRTGSCLLAEAFSLYSPVWLMHEFFRSIDYDPNIEDTFLARKTESIVYNKKYEKLFDLIPPTQFEINVNYIDVLRTIRQVADANQPVVIKIQSYQFGMIDLRELFKLPFVEIVFLKRKNILNSYISSKQATKIKTWHNVSTNDIKVDVDVDEFMQYKKKSDKFNKFVESVIDNSNKNVLKVEYERDLENFTEKSFYSMVTPWLDQVGLDLEKVKGRTIPFVKQRTVGIENCIENYEEVKDLVDSYRELEYDTVN
jgi:LPS sulfotransferase NodH